jgi:hypothetical protein
MNQSELLSELQSLCQTETLRRDLQTISETLFERIDHTILTDLMCLLVENEQSLIDEGVE